MARKKVEKNISFDDVKKLYYVTLNYGTDENGKRTKSTKTFKTKKEAKETLVKFEAAKINGNLVKPSSLLMEEYFNYWLDVKSIKCEQTTLYGYKNIVNKHLIPYFGKFKLQQVTTTHMNKYFKIKLQEGLSKNTVRKHQDLLKHILNYAVKEDKLTKNPLDKIEPIKKEKKEMNYYNIDQLKKLFSIVEGQRMEIVIKLAGMLGLRREEIAGLKWDMVDFNNKTITISRARTQAGKKYILKGTKNTSSHRTLHAPQDILNILQDIKDKQDIQKQQLKQAYLDEDYVIAWENGEPIRPNYLSDMFKKIVDDNNLPPLRFHDLRHTFASVANKLGLNLYDISKTLGHSQVNTTSNIYTHLFDKTHKKTIDKVANVFKD
jgi:integrase